jgi:glucose-6-phosphate 1-dehydrogenase
MPPAVEDVGTTSMPAVRPGPRMLIGPVRMEFPYGSSFLSESLEAYERLILDVMRGDEPRNNEIEALWAIIDAILTARRHDTGTPIPPYPAGSAEPAQAEARLDHGRRWRPL